MVFGLFGVQWVMPPTVLDLFSGWTGSLGRGRNLVVWRLVPHCVIWCLWRERNDRRFEYKERTICFFVLYLSGL